MNPAFRLVMQTGPVAGKAFPLDKGEVFIGRDLNNDIVINDPEVSRRHARLFLQGANFVLEDLGSTNGTSVNGQRLMGPYILRPGEVITLGEKINVIFEGAMVDVDATVSASSYAAPQPPAYTPAPVPQQAAPVYPPPQPMTPQSAYAGQVPAPMPVQPAKKKGGFPIWLVVVIVVLLLAVCVCGGLVYYIDANNMWCQFLPFMPGCQ